MCARGMCRLSPTGHRHPTPLRPPYHHTGGHFVLFCAAPQPAAPIEQPATLTRLICTNKIRCAGCRLCPVDFGYLMPRGLPSLPFVSFLFFEKRGPLAIHQCAVLRCPGLPDQRRCTVLCCRVVPLVVLSCGVVCCASAVPVLWCAMLCWAVLCCDSGVVGGEIGNGKIWHCKSVPQYSKGRSDFFEVSLLAPRTLCYRGALAGSKPPGNNSNQPKAHRK